ncbi:hypothetical protein PHPI107946_08095 [Phocicoccus pinnipedialis]|uniref:Uncharacterized protein n=1 Tax=Phocicoccus pinnipedialis TaxID=110845 RepID=A0A6V7RCZ8_9BACL|nr:hypothetical protein [Jeotgalicoccus pinnipedialis]CAD2074880.1 hypothetical protein JEOPIN946_00842 [Jeotgalicoccus pinnipedialis]
MSKISRAISIGIFVGLLVLLIELISPFNNLAYESLLNVLTIVILTTLFSVLITRTGEKKNL